MGPPNVNGESETKLYVSAEIALVGAFKPPPLRRNNVELWFSQIESQFLISGISREETKFLHVVAILEEDILSYVSDLGTLLSDMQLGDKKPSQLLHEMQDLSLGKIEESVIRMLWFQRLPLTTQRILSASTDKIASLPLTADKMAEVSGVWTCVTSVEVESAHLNRLKVQISELTSVVQQYCKRIRNASPHRRDLEQVFQRLNENGLVLNIEKCIFGADKLPFLGCQVSKAGISPSKEKVEALVDYPQPQDVSALRRFLARLNFYRRFIPNAAEIQRILYDFVKGKKKREKTTIDWSETAVQAFQTCKNSIAQAALLAHPNSEAKLSLAVVAFNTGIAGTLQQTYLKNTQPLAFFSRKLTRAESRYNAYDRELLAVYSSVKHFRHFLEGRDFIIYTDHKPLTFASQQTGEKTSPRHQYYLEFISQLSTDVRYISGIQSTVSDAISRIDEIGIPSEIDYEEIPRVQVDDVELLTLQGASSN
ncbi:Retrovirus-related Pol polyprotein from transposon 297 [Araneus ventricosus]|uniref:RNA-directed DNA polymerase n=1 Tax=Araneus ventricosus TaxID=182803 RepID=A0A4Y2K8P8_ARAVE|nr:Retrovirus-related Pol polyprotein from transposon 297 [Araneus ventricosus]